MGNDGALQAVEALRQRSKLSKDRHFAAAERKGHLHALIGLPAIVINVFMGVVLGNVLQAEKPPQWAPMVAVGLSFVAAALSAILTFFNFAKAAEGHRTVANRYLWISTVCEHLLLENRDQPIAPREIWAKIPELQTLYQKINEDAEALPTIGKDLQKARKKHSLVPFLSPTTLTQGNGTGEAHNEPIQPTETAPSVSISKDPKAAENSPRG
jgi:hypothetical protein